MSDHLSKNIFPSFKCALLHSKINDEEKQDIMEKFRMGEIKILIATSVVEVGVDVPNATCMVVGNAERFGLSALHQLRGRVGRGSAESFCFFIYSDNLSADGGERLRVMLNNNDGFIIAEEDLKLRGPGQIAGTEQSGILRLGLAGPIEDANILTIARKDAFDIIDCDPSLQCGENHVIHEVLERAPPFNV